jgi:UDP-glucose 4-epimerase
VTELSVVNSGAKRLFITGGAGFIGRWLLRRLAGQGYEVTVYDNFSFGKRENLEAFGDKVNTVEGDILEPVLLGRSIADSAPDVVIHLAALHYIPYCNANAAETIRVNVGGTYNVMQALVRAGVPRVLFASSGSVYPDMVGQIVEDEGLMPDDVYGLSKRLSEDVVRFFARTTNSKCTIARLFNVYGAHESHSHLIPTIMSGLRNGPRLELGNLDRKRDYIYAGDVAEIILRLCQSNSRGLEIVNVGTGREYSAAEVVGIIEQIIGMKLDVTVSSERTRNQDKMHQCADIRRLIELTGYHPKYELSKGLKELLGEEGLLS